jgi:hypothetical protein
MSDRILLIVTALTCSFATWAFWHYLGQDALDVLVLVALICALADNWRLRRVIRHSAGAAGETWH